MTPCTAIGADDAGHMIGRDGIDGLFLRRAIEGILVVDFKKNRPIDAD